MTARKDKELVQYLLSDYQFLEDYEVIDSDKANKYSFVACIKDTDQKVRFIKRKYNQQLFPRFKALHRLYKNGIILADNMFILQQCEEYYFYVIEAEIQPGNARFETLHRYLYNKEVDSESNKSILGKLKILVDCLHQEGQAYAGLDPRKIIIDDENHLYLAPFDLQFQLQIDNYSRAYYSPQILTKISREQFQISEQMMQKWDVWSFGCICLELLAYSSPVFISTSLPRQLKQIKQLQIDSDSLGTEQSIKNMLVNSLMLDVAQRTISTNSPRETNTQKVGLETCYKETLSNINQVNKDDLIKGVSMRQLNIHQKTEGDCTLVINLLTLSDVTFEKQLHLSVHLSKTFHFYVDFDEKLPKKYPLNRKITMKGSFQYFQKLLSQPVLIKMKESAFQSSFSISLQSLVLLSEGKRVWSDPVISTYTSKGSKELERARIKIKCILTTPQVLTKSAVQSASSHQKAKQKPVFSVQADINTMKINNECEKQEEFLVKQKADSPQITIHPQNNKMTVVKRSQKSTRGSKKDKIPSISQISQSLSLLTQDLKRKMNEQAEMPSDDIQKQLSSLLQIEQA